MNNIKNKIIIADALVGLSEIPDESVDVCVTSPPYYGLRDYGHPNQIGLEQTPEEYIERLVNVFHEVRRVLKSDGTCWIVIADSYAGSGKGAALYPENAQKYKQGTNKGMVGASRVVNSKTNDPMKACAPRYGGHKYTNTPEKFYRTKSARAYDYRPKRNKRNVWTVTTKPYKGAHFATFPPDLIEPCILAGCREGGIVLDPFLGSGTTAAVAKKNHRDYVGIEVNAEYEPLIRARIDEVEI